MRLDLHHFGVYRRPQTARQRAREFLLVLNLAGVRTFAVEGRPVRQPVPHLLLIAPGETISFQYGDGREDWVAIFATPDLRAGAPGGDTVSVRCGDLWIELPRAVGIPGEGVAGWQIACERALALWQSPTPHDRLRAEFALHRLLGHLIEAGGGEAPRSPAHRLKALLDSDDRTSIERLCRRCGCSPDHLRTVFKRAFHLAPLAYRNRRRMAQAMELIAGSHRSIKQIAGDLGFRHVSHFSTMFRRHHGLAASAAIRRYRLGEAPG